MAFLGGVVDADRRQARLEGAMVEHVPGEAGVEALLRG